MINKKYKLVHDIKCFHDNVNACHKDYHSHGLDQIYSEEEKHFWFITRKQFILKKIINYVKKDANIIEVGAGTGNVSRYLMNEGFSNISVGEMHLRGLKYAREYGIDNCYQFDILNTPFEDEFDAVCLFDVLEHIDDDDQVLLNVNSMLKKSGYIIITVPAHMWLWSREDSIACHKHRYNKKELCNKLELNGFKIITAQYFFMAIIPLLYLRVFLNKETYKEVSDKEIYQEININPIINKILLFITKIENSLSDYLPNFSGGSLFILARKK